VTTTGRSAAIRGLLATPLLAATMPGAARACAGGEAVVRVAVEAPPPTIRRERDVPGLGFMGQMGAVAGSAGRRIVGLTEPDFRFEIDRLALGGRPGCWFPTRIQVTLAVFQTVHLARLRRGGPFHEAAVLEHEMQHVGFNRSAVGEAAASLRATLPGLVPSQARSRGEAHARLAEAIGTSIDEAGLAAVAEAQLEHQRIDSEASFRTIWERCGGR